MKDNRKVILKHINSKRRIEHNISPLLDRVIYLTNRDIGKAETFNAFFTFVFNTDDVLEDCDLGDDKLPADSALVWDLPLQLDAYKSIGLDGIHSRYWMSWPIFLWSLSIIFQRSWESGEVPVNWNLANVPVFKKSKKEDPGNYSPFSLSLVPGKIMEKVILGVTENKIWVTVQSLVIGSMGSLLESPT